MVPKKVLKVSYRTSNPWSYPIWNSINAAEKRNEKYKLPDVFRSEIGSRMLSISYRIDGIFIIRGRLNKEIVSIYGMAKSRDKSRDKFAFQVSQDLVNSLLVNIDSIIFEMKSSCELAESLAKRLNRHYYPISKKIGKTELPVMHWSGAQWYKKLRDIRIDLFHKTAAYVDVDVSKEPQYDLLFCKENIKDYRKTKNYIRLSEISDIYNSFLTDFFILQNYISKKINKL